MNIELFLPLLIILKECVGSSELDHPCPEAELQMGLCLHTYLERDFTGLEAYYEKPVDDGIPLIDDPEIQFHCNNLKKVVVCYSKLDGSCGDLRIRKRFSYMLNGIFQLYSWFCDERRNLKILLENLHCIESVRQDPLCKLTGLIAENFWQQMLRLDIGGEICSYLKLQLTCLEGTRRLERLCGNQSHNLFVYGMNTWLQNWCMEDESYTSYSSPLCIISTVIHLLITIVLLIL